MNLKQFYVGRAIGFVVVVMLVFVLSMFIKKDDTLNKLCYIRNTEDGGSAKLEIGIRGNDVTGYFWWMPSQKDTKIGSITGKLNSAEDIKNGVLNLIWNAKAEGVTNNEELNIKISEGVAAPGFGEMKSVSDMWVYADPNKIVYEPNLSLVDCEYMYEFGI